MIAIPAIRNPLAIEAVGPGFLSPTATFTRSQPSSAVSTGIGSNGQTWQTFAADVPRFVGSARRFLIGGQRTNVYTNPRLEGGTVGVIGSGGALPTNMVWTSTAGLTREIVALSSSGGIVTMDQRISGTPNSTVLVMNFSQTTAVSAGQTVAPALDCAIIAGDFTNVASVQHRVVWTGGTPTSSASTFSPSGTLQRYSTAFVAPTGTTAISQYGMFWTLTVGAAVDFTMRFRLPSVEVAAFASTPILPPANTPGASTRGADLTSWGLPSLGITGDFTIGWAGLIPQNAPSGVDQVIAQADNGTDDNRVLMLNPAGGATIVPRRTTGGTTTTGSSAGTMTAGTLFRAVMRRQGGTLSVWFNGGSKQDVTGAPTSGLTTLRLGSNASAASNLFGETARLVSYPYAMTDAAAQTLSTSLPLS